MDPGRGVAECYKSAVGGCEVAGGEEGVEGVGDGGLGVVGAVNGWKL